MMEDEDEEYETFQVSISKPQECKIFDRKLYKLKQENDNFKVQKYMFSQIIF